MLTSGTTCSPPLGFNIYQNNYEKNTNPCFKLLSASEFNSIHTKHHSKKAWLLRWPGSLHVDLQQRSCEFLELLGNDWAAHRPGILDRMPVPEKDGKM